MVRVIVIVPYGRIICKGDAGDCREAEITLMANISPFNGQVVRWNWLKQPGG